MTDKLRKRIGRAVAVRVASTVVIIGMATVAGSAASEAQGVEPVSAEFSLSADAGLAPLLIQTSNTSSGAESFRWDFGDGGTSEAAAPSHIYVRPGLFVVELEACGGGICDTAIAVVNIEGRDSLDGGTFRPGTTVYGSINQPGDEDDWSIEGSAGSFVTIRMTADIGSPLDPVLRLFAPDGSLAAFNDDAAEADADTAGAAVITDLELKASGTYTIEAGAFLDTVGVYSLSVEVTAADAVRASFELTPPTGIAPLMVRFSSTARNATSFAWDFGDGSRSTLASPSHRYGTGGSFEVTLTACRNDECDIAFATVIVEADDGGPIASGETLANRIDYEDDVDRFTFDAPAGAEVTIDLVADDDAFDALLFLFGPDGEEVASDDDGGAGLNSRIRALPLLDGGTYAIDAQAFPGGGEGGYTLSLVVDAEPVVRASIDVSADSFIAPATMTFSDASLGGPTSWTWSLDGVTAGSEASLVQTFEEAGTFVVALEACNVRSCDRWSVAINVSAESDGGPIAIDQTVFGAIDRGGDSDDWTFEASAGQVVSVRAFDLSGALDPALELRDADGTIVAFDDDSGGDLNPLIDGVTLEAAGTYTIRVRSFSETATGSYRLELSAADG